MVKNAKRRLERKEQESKELDFHLEKEFFCGSCSIGCSSLQEYEEHCREEEHEFHIQRRIKSLVPGLGFCAACCCLIQTSSSWEHHKESIKHIKCIHTLTSIGITGSYDIPLGCQTLGELGTPIEPSEIDQRESIKHGYGDGSKLCKWSNLIGLDQVKELSMESKESQDVNYKCSICNELFTFEHRGSHLVSLNHRLKYMEQYYPEWYADVETIDKSWFTRRFNRCIWYASKIEQIEKEKEGPEAKKLRQKFFEGYTKRKASNKREPSFTHTQQHYAPHRARGHIPHRGVWPRGRGRPFSNAPVGYVEFPPYDDSYSQEMGYGNNPRGLGGQRGLLSGKRPQEPWIRSSKRVREHDPYADAGYADQLESGYDPYYQARQEKEYTDAMEAINVLETFAMIKAKDNIKSKIDQMKASVMYGEEVDPSELFNYVGDEEGPYHETYPLHRGLPTTTVPLRGSRGGMNRMRGIHSPVPLPVSTLPRGGITPSIIAAREGHLATRGRGGPMARGHMSRGRGPMARGGPMIRRGPMARGVPRVGRSCGMRGMQF